ncbi:hypothetical protein BDF21DRAFT_341855 [Thamnidium elegans]|nr:hypothetical protein BDF21DRAFT_341855 [Thamnidium elegans]
MSLVRYSLKDRSRWKAIECGSAEVPLTFADNKKFLKVLDLFAFVYGDIQSQQDIFDKIEEEHLGYENVPQEDIIETISQTYGR